MNEPALTEITLDDIESLAVGAWILGTGGGGSPYLGPAQHAPALCRRASGRS